MPNPTPEDVPRSKSLRPKPPQRSVVMWIAVAAVVLVAGGFVYAMITNPPEATRPTPPVPSAAPTASTR
jgi:hypothetical protein